MGENVSDDVVKRRIKFNKKNSKNYIFKAIG